MIAIPASLLPFVQTYHPPSGVISERTVYGQGSQLGDPIHYEPDLNAIYYGSQGGGSWSMLVILIFAAMAVLVVGFILHRYLQGRQEVAKARFEALGKLAEGGAVHSREAQQVMPELRPTRRPPFLWRAVVVIAWLTLLSGILCFILAGFARGHDFEELIMGGVICSFVATAVFATPFMFRELRKQGVV